MTPTPSPFPLEISGGLSWDGVATIIAALIAVGSALLGYFLQQHWSRRREQRIVYAEALRAVHDYLELPYLVRRRQPGDENRASIIRNISEVQSRLNFYSNLLDLEASPRVAQAYRRAVASARAEAGSQMKEAWKRRPAQGDRAMSLGVAYPHPATDAAMGQAAVTMR